MNCAVHARGDVGAELAFCRRWDEVYASIEHDDPAQRCGGNFGLPQ
jgi:hypothetical protein